MDKIQAIRTRIEDSRERVGREEFTRTLESGLHDSLEHLAERIDFDAGTLYGLSLIHI